MIDPASLIKLIPKIMRRLAALETDPTLSGTVTTDRLRLSATNDASLSSTGHPLQVGPTSGINSILDGNEIMGRNNGAASFFGINIDGGDVQVGNVASGGITLASGNTMATGGGFYANPAGADHVHNDTVIGSGKAFSISSTVGFAAKADGVAVIGNRVGSDGLVFDARRDGTSQGGVQISGATVSIAAVTIAHWSQFTDHGRPDILPGTILESLDEMCLWLCGRYTDVVEHRERVRVKGPLGIPVKRTVTHRTPVDKVVELPISFRDRIGQEVEFEGRKVIVEKQPKDNLAKCRIATLRSDRVLGSFMFWDGDYSPFGNDLNYAGGGTWIVRMAADAVAEGGDLIESDANGCGIVQADRIKRSSTVAKIVANVRLATYPDGTYILPCFVVSGN